MARTKATLSTSAIITKGQIPATEIVDSAASGQPVIVVKWPAEVGAEVLSVKLCPDGAAPDYVVGRAGVSISSAGDLIPAGLAGAPLSIGGVVKRGDWLTVKSGRFVKAIKGDRAICEAGADAIAGDLIAAATLSFVIP